MLKFIESKSDRSMLQFIVNLLYLGMKSGNGIWAEENGTKSAVVDLLSAVSGDFIKVANDILLNGSITITADRRLAKHERIPIDVEGYQDIVDVLRYVICVGNFSNICKSNFERLTKVFSMHEDSCVLKNNAENF